MYDVSKHQQGSTNTSGEQKQLYTTIVTREKPLDRWSDIFLCFELWTVLDQVKAQLVTPCCYAPVRTSKQYALIFTSRQL